MSTTDGYRSKQGGLLGVCSWPIVWPLPRSPFHPRGHQPDHDRSVNRSNSLPRPPTEAFVLLVLGAGLRPMQIRCLDAGFPQSGPRFGGTCAEANSLTAGGRCILLHEDRGRLKRLKANSQPLAYCDTYLNDRVRRCGAGDLRGLHRRLDHCSSIQ